MSDATSGKPLNPRSLSDQEERSGDGYEISEKSLLAEEDEDIDLEGKGDEEGIDELGGGELEDDSTEKPFETE